MESKFPIKNHVEVMGIIQAEASFSHEVHGEKFYNTVIRSVRLSENADEIPILVSGRIWEMSGAQVGDCIQVKGQFRSYNSHEEDKNRLVLSVLAQEMEVIADPEGEEMKNSICLDGFLCKKPIYRTTPLGREITDVLVAVNRAYGKSDYIPCICWGKNARYAGGLAVGDRISLEGRIQSRCYKKKHSEDHVEDRVAYEVSVSRIEAVTDRETPETSPEPDVEKEVETD